MGGEVPIEVPDDKVSVRPADLTRDVKSLVSYGVGCMFGRYSIDVPGLILADGVKANYGKAEFAGALRKVAGLS